MRQRFWGWVIALAVLTHDVADGVNTVSLSLAARSEAAARRWLVLNGVAPMLGVIIGLAISIPSTMLAPLMALFAGIFLYIGACELVPRSQSLDPRLRTGLGTIAGIVLMLAWMNRESFDETVRTGRAVYFSRSRKKLWLKGESSGETFRLVELLIDCDQDCLLARVKAEGSGKACHTGRRSCFYRAVSSGHLKMV